MFITKSSKNPNPVLVSKNFRDYKLSKKGGVKIDDSNLNLNNKESVFFQEKSETPVVREEDEQLKNLFDHFDNKQRSFLLELFSEGKLEEKDIISLVKEKKELDKRNCSPPVFSVSRDEGYNIADFSEGSKKALLKYIDENKLEKNDVKLIISNDKKWRHIEQLVSNYFNDGKEEEKDIWINMWSEQKKQQKNRFKLLMALSDELNKEDAEIWSHRCKINQKISDIYYKTLIGSD